MSLLPTKVPRKTKQMAQTIFVFLLVLTIFSFSTQINPFYQILHGVQSTLILFNNKTKSTYNYIFKSRAQLQEDLAYYQNLSSELSKEIINNRDTEQQNKELESLINYKETLEYSSISARIIAHSAQNKKEVLIDKGADSELQIGLAVIIEDGHLIGILTNVYQHSSVVTLIQNSNSKIPSAILDSNKTIGLVEGQNGFLLKMEFIPQNENIQQSNIVMTSGLDGIIPKGLIIGTVDSVISNDTDPFQQAYIRPVFDVNNYTNVLILNPFIK